MPATAVKSYWSSGNLVFEEAIRGNDAAVYFGANDYGIDVKFFGATSGKYALWDQSADKLIVAGDLQVTGTPTFSGALASTGTVAVTNAPTSATPGTIRAVIGEVAPAPATTITSGTLVGVRGHLNYPAKTVTGGAYLIGTQGKLTFAGTMNHEDSRLAGLFAQLDTTGATLSSGQLSALWVDMGAGVSGAGGGQFNMIRVSNTVAGSKPNSVMYVYSDATYLFDLAGGPAGAQSYVVAAGTSSGSFGNADGVATKVLVISIGGTAYYIPTHTQNT